MARYYVDENGNISTKRKKTTDYQVDEVGNISYIDDSTSDDDIAPVKGGNKNSVFKSGGFSDGVDGVGDFFLDLGETVAGTAGDLGLGILKGVGRLAEGVVDLGTYGVAGVADLFGADEFADKTRKVAQYSATDEWTKGATNWLDQYSVLGNKADMVSEGIGQVGTIILTGGLGAAGGLSSAGATALTTAITAASGMGSGMNEAYASGASDGKAVAYGATVGTIEAATELIFGGLGKGVKALGVSKGLTSIDDVFAKKLSNTAAKFIASEAGQKVVGNTLEYAVKSSAEGVEEVLSGIGSAMAKDLYLLNGEDEKAFNEILKDENLLEQFVVGSIVSGIAQGGDFISSNRSGRDFVSGLSKNEQTVVDKVYEQRLAEESENKTLSNKDKNKLYERVVEEMKRGYVTTDEIESILGGETYKGYKDLTDKKTSLEERKTAIENEIKDLVKTPESQFTVEQREKLTSLREETKNIDKSLSSLGIDEAKSNLFNEVDKLTSKDTYLRESYNEIARRRQAFKADLTKYTGKQKEAVQRAIDSGVLNNTNRSHELVDTLSKIEADKGIVFDYTNNKKLKESGFAVEGKTVNGFVKDGGVTLNVQSQKAWQSTVGHEISHVLEGTEAYGALREAVYAYAKSKGEFDGRKAELTELYNGMNADIDAELTADLIGDYLFTDKDFINHLTGNRNLFQKVYDEIKYLCKIATGKELTEIEKVKREFDRAWKEQGQIAQSEEHSDADDSGESDINYSISVTDKATRNFLDEQVAKGEYDAETNPDGGYYVTYKSMSFWGYDEDGNAILRSPMAEYVDGELSNAYLIPKDKSKLNWYKATETIDENTGLPSGLMVKVKKDGNKSFTYLPAAENQDLIKEDWSNLYFNLQKKVLKNGKWVSSDVPARYNPYEHSSNSMLNDQFSAAYLRDNLVTVKMYVPVSEDNGAYRAKWSKDPTGWSDWKTGTVAGKIGKQKDLQRKVYLSRYAAPVEIVPDSEVAQAYKEYLDGTDVTIPDNVVSPNLLNELKKAGVPITESGKVKYSLSEDIDKNGNLGYNGNELYTTTDEFYLDVDKADRDAFPRSLANKTTGMEKDEIRTVEIYGVGKVYFFEATGYMQGQMLYSANINDVSEYRTAKKEFLNGNNGSRQTFGSWASVFSFDGTGTRSDIHSTENRRAESNVYEVYGEPRTRNGTGTQERIGENFKDDPEEVKRVIKALREEYGFAENHPTNEIAPTKEVSSTDDAFFDGENPKFSLSTDEKKADADYSFAVNSGDTETAQRMVDEKAKESGYTVRAYHGTGRADRVGNVFLPERATSGPMAFFTDNKDIASNYARDKADTSLAYDEEYDSYYTQFRVNRNGKSISIPELWKHLSVSERNRIKEQAGHIKFDDDYETIIVDESAQHGNGAWDAYTLNYHRGNALEALVDTWLESGDLYNQEELFLEVLKNVGITDAEYRNPDARYEKVYDTWLKIQNPFDTDNADQSFYDGLSEWIDNNDMSVYEKESADADMWDKNNQTPESWLGKLESDIESGTTHAWTVIPDFVTDYLKAQGYDGIKDKGGKGGGAGHTVWIPFSSEQVKSAEPVTYDDNGKLIPLSQRFDSSKVDIRNSLSTEGEKFAPIGNYSTPLNETALEQDIAPVAENVAENATADAPMPDEIVPMTEEEANALQDEKANADAKLEGDPKSRKQLHSQILDKIKSTFRSKGYEFDDVLRNAKNLSTFSTVDNTPQRVMEKALGYKEGQALADLTVNKVAQNETEGIKWLNSFTDRKNGLLAQISKQYNIKPGSKESAAAQMYAEGFYVNENNDIVAYGDAELEADFPDARVRSGIKGLATDTRIRQIYDETLDAINRSRTRNAYPEIQKLDNYFLHFRAMEDTFSKLGLPFNPNDIKAKDLPTDLNGVTADLKPGQPYFASAMHRKGKRTSFDLLGGLERYLTSAKNQIYHIDDIQTLRALRNYIADNYGQAHGLESIDILTEEEAQAKIEQVYGSHLSTFAKFLNEEANILAGKTSLIDRGIEGLIGRRFMTFLDTVRKQTGSNMVGYNISSSLTNFLPVAQTLAKSNKFDFLKAFAQTTSNKFGSVFGKGDSFAENSPVMIRRKGADRFYRTPFQKVGDAGYVFMGAVDNISTELIARTKFNELTRKGMSEQQAHTETDKWVSRLMGDRSLGQMPQLYNSKSLGFITQFQLEVRNQLDSQFYDTIQETKVSNEEIENNLVKNAKTAAKITSTFVQLAVAQHLFGKAFESVAGYNPAFDIIEVLSTMFGFDDDEESKDTALDNLEQGFLALLEDLPYTSAFTGGRIPISSALPIKQFVTGKDSYGNEKSRVETLLDVAPYYLLPGGYGQIKKTAQGLNMFSDDHPIAGSYTDSGNLRFPVEDTLGNRIQAGIFGQYASENAREYFDNGYAPLKEKQIQEYMDVDMPIADYWKYREGLSGLKTQAEKADYINSLNIEDWQKNLLMNNILDRKEDVDMSNYDDYSNWEEFDYAQKNPDKYAFAKSVGGYYDYKAYSEALYNIKADKDEYGKSITGSRKEKVLNYINNLDADYETKIILWKSEYPSDDTYNMEIINYLNNRADLTYEERVAILTELGFTVSNGSVYWD